METTVEALGKGREVTLGVLGELEGVIGPTETGLDTNSFRLFLIGNRLMSNQWRTQLIER